MKHLFIFLTLLTCTYSNFIINPYVIAPSGSAELPTANLVAHYQPSGISRHGLDIVSGTASISDSAPKFGTGALVNVNGTDHIQEGVSSDWDHGTNDWTYETWVKNSLTEANRPMFANMTGGTMNATNIAVAIRVSGETIHAEVSDGATLTTMTNGSTGWNDNAWHHFAFVRQGTTLRFYLDGVELSNSTSYTASLNSGKKMTWGSNEDGTSGVTQRFDEMRISSICRYPDGTTFSVATAPFTADANTLYLNHCDGTDTSARFYDSALPFVTGHGLATIVGDAQLDTAIKKYGTASLLLDGANDAIEYPASSDFEFTADFTVECFFRIDLIQAGAPLLMGVRNPSAINYWEMDIDHITGTHQIRSIFNTASGFKILSSSTNLSINTWYHFAICRQGTTLRMYLDGIQQSTDTLAGAFTSSDKFVIGPKPANTIDFDGNVDEVRISDGVCRYPDGTNFTPPTTAFVYDSSTVLLLPMDGEDGSTIIQDQALAPQAFSLWVDDSGNELDVVQNTGASQPLGTPNALDGFGGATFDGSDDSLSASTVADWKFLHDGTDYTIFIIANSNQNGTTQVYLSTNNAGSADEGFTFYHDDTNNNGVVFVSKGSVGNPNFNLIMNNDSIPNDAYHSIMIKHENGAGGNDLTTEVDATAEGSQEPSNLPFSSSNPLSALCVGCLPNGTSDFDGVMIEIIIYNVALSTGLIDDVNAYKNAKYPSLP